AGARAVACGGGPWGAQARLGRWARRGGGARAEARGGVQLWFNERLEPAYSQMSVWSAAGAQVDRGDARVDPDDARQLRVTLAPLARGAYTVRYRVLSVDGHVVESSFPFTVTGGPAAR